MKYDLVLKKQLDRRARIYNAIRSKEKSYMDVAREEGISVTAVQMLIKRHEKALQKV